MKDIEKSATHGGEGGTRLIGSKEELDGPLTKREEQRASVEKCDPMMETQAEFGITRRLGTALESVVEEEHKEGGEEEEFSNQGNEEQFSGTVQTQRHLLGPTLGREEFRDEPETQANPNDIEYPLLPLEEVDMNQVDVVDDLSKYNLFLLRSIYEAFDEKGDKVFQSFRKKLFNKMLRPKMLVLKEGPYPPRKRTKNAMIVSAEDESVYVEVKSEVRDGDGQLMMRHPEAREGDG